MLEAEEAFSITGSEAWVRVAEASASPPGLIGGVRWCQLRTVARARRQQLALSPAECLPTTVSKWRQSPALVCWSSSGWKDTPSVRIVLAAPSAAPASLISCFRKLQASRLTRDLGLAG